MNDGDAHDRLISSLRAEARGYDPALPDGMHRRVLEAVAGAGPVGRRGSGARWAVVRWAVVRWVGGVGSVAAAVVVGFVVSRERGLPPDPAPVPAVAVGGAPPLLAPDPVALAHRLTNDPLAAEVRAIVDDLTRATSTVTNVLPARVRAKPAAGNTPSSSRGPTGRGGLAV